MLSAKIFLTDNIHGSKNMDVFRRTGLRDDKEEVAWHAIYSERPIRYIENSPILRGTCPVTDFPTECKQNHVAPHNVDGSTGLRGMPTRMNYIDRLDAQPAGGQSAYTAVGEGQLAFPDVATGLRFAHRPPGTPRKITEISYFRNRADDILPCAPQPDGDSSWTGIYISGNNTRSDAKNEANGLRELNGRFAR